MNLGIKQSKPKKRAKVNKRADISPVHLHSYIKNPSGV